ncbi:MAG: MBL fold metallo-hydrolase [Methanomicrobia archaeon]|nr:MBL fold metallo-hydrolase [Methanomicrobia archaeon]
MHITEHIHALKIPFQLTSPAGTRIARFVYVYLMYGDTICLIDSGVAGSEHVIFDYLKQTDRRPDEITTLVLTHAHPDHIGAARAIQQVTGCTVAAHRADRLWIENVERQFRDRPIPNFPDLVGGSVAVDHVLKDNEVLDWDRGLTFAVLHTPGHSNGSISLWLDKDHALISGDAVPRPGDVPIYDDVAASARSLQRLRALEGIRVLLSSWDDPQTDDQAYQALDEGLNYLHRIHSTVMTISADNPHLSSPELCALVLDALGLPATSANPLFARTIEAHRAAASEPVTEENEQGDYTYGSIAGKREGEVKHDGCV